MQGVPMTEFSMSAKYTGMALVTQLWQAAMGLCTRGTRASCFLINCVLVFLVGCCT